jgi:hypothetical protein
MAALLAILLQAQAEEPPGQRFDLALGRLFVAEHFKAGEKADLLVHFHGAAKVVEREFARAKKNALLVTVNAKGLSAAYARAMEEPEALQKVIDEALAKAGNLKPGRLFVSSFSAGYGAVRRVLLQGKHEIAWLHLADSLHAGYAEKKPQPDQMAPFVAYAKSGKPLWLTHSAVVPGTYASTTETADALIEAVGAKREKADEKNARGMKLVSKADQGEFHVRGYEGDTGEAHLEHLRNLGEYFATLP